MTKTTCDIEFEVCDQWLENCPDQKRMLRKVGVLVAALCDDAKPSKVEADTPVIKLRDFRHESPNNDEFYPMSNIVIDVESALRALNIVAEAKWPGIQGQVWNDEVGFRCTDLRVVR